MDKACPVQKLLNVQTEWRVGWGWNIISRFDLEVKKRLSLIYCPCPPSVRTELKPYGWRRAFAMKKLHCTVTDRRGAITLRERTIS